ncbi:hypothetical protein AruPA_06080 [Acidiphilium sp. PA]|uniref:hypothetical protein n=1 Tax=Acidiphilium sp. PA TaxID=2871705 RepID=UPI00224424FD|nr:hypothetical protein [Acidiphilium sp. PA]MCW8306598.1 hypothetical protein [Acidiphilium sp. PA]
MAADRREIVLKSNYRDDRLQHGADHDHVCHSETQNPGPSATTAARLYTEDPLKRPINFLAFEH